MDRAHPVKSKKDINPTYIGMKRSFPKDSKIVLFIDMELAYTSLDLIESCRWVGEGGLVRLWA